ncbi:MAG: MFS transporter [Planctomycetota bacterium]|jgi:MFS family permease
MDNTEVEQASEPSGNSGASRIDKRERRQGLRISTLDGIFGAVHGNLTGGVIFTSFLLALGAQKIHFAVLNAVSALAQLFQIFSAFWLSRLSRRKPVVIISALLSRIVLSAIVFFPYIMPIPMALKAVIGAAFLWGALGSVAVNAWTGWMSDLVPRRLRGRYFSTRNYAGQIAAIISSLLICWFIDQFSKGKPGGLLSMLLPSLSGKWIFVPENKMAAFVFLYLLAAIPAVVCALLTYRQYEPERLEAVISEKLGFLKSIREPLRYGVFVNLLIFSGLFSFLNSFAAPYWMPFCLEAESLGMTNFALALCWLLAMVGGLLTAKFWGRLCDRFGNRPVMILTMFIMCIHPIYYLVSTKKFTLLIYLDYFSSGVAWAGFGVALNNFLLLTGKTRDKEMFFAVYATVGAVVVFVGSLLSGVFVEIIPSVKLGSSLWSNVEIIFLSTILFRIFLIFIALKLIVEPRAKGVFHMIRNTLRQKRAD